MRLRPGELVRVGLAAVAAVALVVAFWAFRDDLPGVSTSSSLTYPTGTPTAAPTSATLGDIGGPKDPSPSAVPSSSSPPETNKALRAYHRAQSNLRARAEQRSRDLAQFSEFRMASYNVLGASHTGGHGDRASWAAGPTRMGWAVQTLNSLGVDVVSFQEFQASQAATFRAIAGGTYGMFPSPQSRGWEGQNTVAWRLSRFELVDAKFNYYPYFGGHLRPYPMVLLRDRQSGVEFWVTSQHNPFYKSNAGARHRAVAMEASDANRLLSTPGHAPLIFAGDMNDRSAFFCAYAGSAPMHSASGGSTVGGCSMPPLPAPYGFDWIMGSPGVEFTNYGFSHSGIAARTSDHPVVWSDAKVWKGDQAPVG